MDYGCDILLFGTMADIGPTVRDDLSGHGLNVVLEDFPQNTCRDLFGYGRKLGKLVAEHHPGAVIPIGDTLAPALIAREPHPDWKCAMISAEADTVELLDSKVHTYALAAGLGIRQPRRLSLEEASRMDDFDLIFKRDKSFGGSGVHRPRNLASLENLIAHEKGMPFLVEEYIDGEDLSVDCVRTAGFFRAEAYVSLGRNQTQGPSADRMATDCPEAVEVARRILDHLDYRGVCGMDFRRTPDGELYFLECNARFTGGIRTQIGRGFDIPFLLYSKWLEH